MGHAASGGPFAARGFIGTDLAYDECVAFVERLAC